MTSQYATRNRYCPTLGYGRSSWFAEVRYPKLARREPETVRCPAHADVDQPEDENDSRSDCLVDGGAPREGGLDEKGMGEQGHAVDEADHRGGEAELEGKDEVCAPAGAKLAHIIVVLRRGVENEGVGDSGANIHKKREGGEGVEEDARHCFGCCLY